MPWATIDRPFGAEFLRCAPRGDRRSVEHNTCKMLDLRLSRKSMWHYPGRGCQRTALLQFSPNLWHPSRVHWGHTLTGGIAKNAQPPAKSCHPSGMNPHLPHTQAGQVLACPAYGNVETPKTGLESCPTCTNVETPGTGLQTCPRRLTLALGFGLFLQACGSRRHSDSPWRSEAEPGVCRR